MSELLVNIDVDDLERAEAFYIEALGLRAGRRFGVDGVELLGANARVYLLVKPSGSSPFAGARAPRTFDRHWTPVHLDFVVDDLDGAVGRAVGAGARLENRGDHAWGSIAYCSDPFGHGFCLIRFTTLGYDAIATGIGPSSTGGPGRTEP
jgi:predicted enzyme related to lactoylglutathione lyase